MDTIDYSQILEDDDNHSLFDAETQLGLLNTPNFEFFDNVDEDIIFSNDPQPSTSGIQTNRFPEYSDKDIQDLKAVATNYNTTRSTKTWMNVFNSWCKARNVQENILTLPPEKLDKILCKFYAEVKMRNGEDYEPESLNIMQAAIDRYLKENKYSFSITRAREFNESQKVLNAKAVSLRQQGKGKRPNKSKSLTSEEENKLWTMGELGSHNAKALSNTNFKILTEQMGLRGRQEHHDAYVEDFVIRSHLHGSESVEFSENPTKTRSGGLRIPHRTTPQIMWSTDGGERDPVALFKLWLSKRPEGMKDNGPLYLSIIARPKCNEVWYTKIRMGENTIGNIIKSITACLGSDKKLTNHSMRKTLVKKLKKSGQPRHKIKEITGHARESSLDDYDEIDEEERKEISHIISGFSANKKSASSTAVSVSHSVKSSSTNSSSANSSSTVTDIQVANPQSSSSFNSVLQNSLTSTAGPAMPWGELFPANYSFLRTPFFIPPHLTTRAVSLLLKIITPTVP